MQCVHCGAENRELAKFCKGCGKSLSGSTTSVAAIDAPSGGACPRCGHSNKAFAKFCSSCGNGLAVSAPPPPPRRVERVSAEGSSSTTGAMPPRPALAKAQRKGSGLYVGIAVGLIAVASAWAAYYWKTKRDTPGPAAVAVSASAPESVSSAPLATPVSPEPSQSASTPASTPVATPVAAPTVTPAPPMTPAAATTVPVAAPVAPQPIVPDSVPGPAPPRPQATPPKPSTVQGRRRPAPPPVAEQRPSPPPIAAPTPVSPPPQPKSAELPSRPSEPAWYVSLKAEVARCKEKDNFFSRTLCEERAKLHYCGPGDQWGKVPECVQPQQRRAIEN